jgi:hypothetical protein
MKHEAGGGRGKGLSLHRMHSDTRIQAEKQMKSVQNQLKIIDEKYLA